MSNELNLPLWMIKTQKRKATEGSTEKDTQAATTSKAPETDGEPSKRRLRSNFVFPSEEKTEPIVQNDLPFIEYTGAIDYCHTLPDIAFKSNKLLKQLLSESTDQDIPIAFDLEWPMDFKNGPGRTALMQLCGKTDSCLLLQICRLKRVPAALTELLYHPRVVLHGVNIKNDIRKLARDFPEVNADRMIARCVDLGQWYNQLNESTGRWSLARLVEQVLKLRINKNRNVRTSQWNFFPLSADQKLYAAIDVYIGQKLYLCLAEKQSGKNNVENNVLEEEDKAIVVPRNIPQQVADVEKLPLNINNNVYKQ